jgi:hypothetical protein
MIEAGVEEFCAHDARFDSAEEAVISIFRRMVLAGLVRADRNF